MDQGQAYDRGGVAGRLWPILGAAMLLALSLTLFWPGVALFDAVLQYGQALSGRYDDWHPPIMAWLWRRLLVFGPGAGAMLALQMTSYWLGLGLLAQAVGGRRALALLAIGAWPLFLGWQGAVLKDGQMTGALTLAAGLVGFWRLRGRRAPWPALLLAAALIAYASLVRANAVFSTVPLVALLLPASVPRAVKAALVVVGVPAAILASQAINLGLLQAEPSGVQRVEAVWDLSAIAARTGDGASAGLGAGEVAALRANRCIKPLFWDPLSELPPCETAIQTLAKRPAGQLYVDLVKAMVRHPLAYLEWRLAHLNSTDRWLVGMNWPVGAAPVKSEPNTLGLAGPGHRDAVARWKAVADVAAETPLGWPIIWIALGLWGLWAALARPPDPRRDLALALLGSALCQEASFAALSISSDLRYHLWTMLAVALAWAILAQRPVTGRRWRLAAAVLAVLILSGLAARAVLPRSATAYAATLTQE
ncbi:MAG TPA: hypothetical protein VGM25_17875 [Caulobacteraceae bacterium]|jgi:hypothetical protein